jgi:hypothetical protein
MFNLGGSTGSRSDFGLNNDDEKSVFRCSRLDFSTSPSPCSSSLRVQSRCESINFIPPSLPNNNKHDINIVVVNCRSVKNKRAELEHTFLNSDVVIGTESWLAPDISDSEIFPLGYRIYRRDRPLRKGGGVFIAVKTHLHSTVHTLNGSDIESVWCTIRQENKRNIHICSFYRPPDAKIDAIYELDTQISNFTSRDNKSVIVIGGDFNLPDINWEAYTVEPSSKKRLTSAALLNTFTNHSLTQLVHVPTRKNKVLDLLAVSHPLMIKNLDILEGISDHKVISATIKTTVEYTVKPKRKVYLFKKCDFVKFGETLEVSFTEFLINTKNKNTEESWTLFLDILRKEIDKHIPHKFKNESREPRWYNHEIRRELRRQRYLHSAYKKAMTSENKTTELGARESYITQRSKTKKLMRTALRNYKKKILGELLHENPKIFWSYAKELQGKSPKVDSLVDKNGKVVTTSFDKAQTLNCHFESVYTEDTAKHQSSIPTVNEPMADIIIKREGIINLLRSIKSNKSPGPEEIPARVLKELAPQIALFLEIIFTKSINEGKVPEDWKIANVTPIFKKGNRQDPGNYRPISLTSLSCKILEHIIVSNIMTHLDNNDFLHKSQHGFRKFRSCETQLALFLHDILTSGESKKQVDAVFLDFKKAFDKVPHNKLILKLQSCGLNLKMVNWIRDFLSDRKQKVVIDGISSDIVRVTSGVPQGSVIGPLLFLIYINDLNSRVMSKIRLFADDAVIYREISDDADIETLSSDLNNVNLWCHEWGLELNLSKCTSVHFLRKSSNQQHTYTVNGINIKTSEEVTYLGVTLTSDLSWGKHIRNICGTALKKLGFIKRVLGRYTDQKVKERCYFALVRPHLEYAASIWDPAHKESILQINKIQRKAARFVKNCYERTESVTRLLDELGWESLGTRRLHARLRLLDRFRTGLFHDEVESIILTPHYVSRHDKGDKIREIHCRTERYKNSFFPRTINDHNKQ